LESFSTFADFALSCFAFDDLELVRSARKFLDFLASSELLLDFDDAASVVLLDFGFMSL
jgi:hypothetical protein